jgi:hypothetical protein
MTTTISRLYNSIPTQEGPFVTSRRPVSHTTISTSSRATPTTGTPPIANRTRVRSRIAISTARMTVQKRLAPAPEWARQWEARPACWRGSA